MPDDEYSTILKAFAHDEAPEFELIAVLESWYIDFIASFCVTCWAYTIGSMKQA